MFKKGDAVVIWRKNGEGIYDGNINYVRKVMSTRQGVRYGLSDANEGSPRGYMEPDVLIAADDFQKMIDSGEVQRLWEGDIEKLTRVLARRTAQPQPATAPTAGRGGENLRAIEAGLIIATSYTKNTVYANTVEHANEALPVVAADLAALREQVAALSSERDAMRAALDKAAEVARDVQGEWVDVTRLHSPQWTHPYKDIDDIASSALEGRVI